jgi:hypothetical protein
VRIRARKWGFSLLTASLVAGFLGGGSALAVAGADEVADGGFPFVAKVSFGDDRTCSGALVAKQWIVTAKDCFANGTTPVAAGVPARPTTVVVGRTDVTTRAGKRLAVTGVVPHPDRNLVLAQLSANAGVTPVPIARTAPAEGDTLRIAGYGRTATEWVPSRLHAGAFTVRSASAGKIEVVGASAGATLCKGDSGGPAFRETSGGVELVGIGDSSWQKGCVGEPASETRGEGYGTRVDDLAGWVATTTSWRPDNLREIVMGEFTRDGFQDLIAVDKRGWGWLFPSTSASTWGPPSRLSSTWSTYKELVVARIDRDGYDDLMALTDTGTLVLYSGNPAGGVTGKGTIGTGYGGYRDLAVGKLNGDAYAALYAIETSTNAWFKFPQTSAGGAFSTTRTVTGGGWGCCKQNVFGNFNADNYLDLVTVESTGKIRLYAGDATGALAVGVAVDAAGTGWGSASAITPGKFDGTGLDGLAEVDTATGTLYLHRRTADGGWAARVVAPGAPWLRQPSDMVRSAGGNFNRDSYQDLIGIDADGNGWIFYGTAANTWGAPERLSSTWSTYKELIVGRVDRDAYDDLVVLNDAGQLLFYAGVATGGVTGKGTIGTGYGGYRDLTIGRLNGDTYDALFAIESSTGVWYKFAQTSAGGAFSTTRAQTGSGWNCCKQNVFGNINGDAYLDLLSVESATGKLRLYAADASRGLTPFAYVDAAGTGWANRDLAAGSAGVLAKDTSGGMLLYPSGPRGIDWSDPITYGPRG